MDYIIRDSTDRELDAMKRYSSDLIDYSMVKRQEEVERLKRTGNCIDGMKHEWVRKWKNKNEMIRYCRKDCGIIRRRVFTNDDLRYIEANLGDFAQPGSILWKKIYGDRTAHEVQNLKNK